MSKILIIGNVLKDVYLRLDEQQHDFEKDEKDINWLELAFNGSSHSFLRRTSVYGGAAVSLSVLNQLGIEAGILNSKTEIRAGELIWSDDPSDYRYILSYGGGITYFVPKERKPTDWTMPSGRPEWILVDRSTSVSDRLVDELKNFLKFSNGTKLAVHIEKRTTPAGQRLAEMADILFVEEEPPVHTDEKIVDKIETDEPDTQLVCHITPRKIFFGEAEESWSLDRADMMTHLTVYSTIVATILGVIIAGGTPADALLWARLNAEGATLEGALTTARLRELARIELEKRANLRLITRSLMTTGKGILAIDESGESLAKRFEKYKIRNTSDNRKKLYALMLTTPGMNDGISGVILSKENAKQKVTVKEKMLDFLTNRGVIPGIKVDQGLAETGSGETHTLGLNGLFDRLRASYKQGFRFAKWRAAFWIHKDTPGFFTIRKNVEELASFAKECQLAGIVPVAEVDMVKDGDYSIERCAEVTSKVLLEVFEELNKRRVDLNGCLLKCSMVTAGNEAEGKSTDQEVGMATAAILKHAVPRYLGGVLLLSGGQEAKEATKDLVAVMHNSPFPWPVTFAFSRAFEEPVLATWKGDDSNIKGAQAAFSRHLAANVDALHYGRFEAHGGNSTGAEGQIRVLDLS